MILSIVGKLREGLLHFSWNSSLVNVPPSLYADWNCLLSISAYSLESEIRRLFSFSGATPTLDGFWCFAQSRHLQRWCSGRPSTLSAAGAGPLFGVVCTGPSVPLCLASASSSRHGQSSWWAGEEWVRSRAYSPWPEPAYMGCNHWLPYEECLWTGSTFLQRWLSPSVVPSCQPGQSWLSLVGPSSLHCTVEWILAPVSSSVGGWSLFV